MARILFLFSFLNAFITSFGQEVLYNHKPFNGKGKIKEVQMVTHKPSQQIVSIVQSNAARKITILKANKEVVAEYSYLLTGLNGIANKAPTEDKYTTLETRVSELLESAPIDIRHCGSFLEEVYAGIGNMYYFLSTDISNGVVTMEEIQVPPKSFVLGLVRNEDTYHILYGIKRSNEMVLFTKKAGKPLERQQLKVDLEPLIKEGIIVGNNGGQLHKIHPAYIMASIGESIPSTPKRGDGFSSFDELTQMSRLMVEDNVLNMYLNLEDGVLLKIGINLETSITTVFGKKIDYTNVKDKIRNHSTDMEGIDFSLIAQKPTYFYFGCSKEFYSMLHITKENCLLSIINRSNYTVDHAYYFDKQGRGLPVNADSAVKPMKYYAEIPAEEMVSMEKFFKILNSLSPAAVQFFKLNDKEFFLALEVDDARLKAKDIILGVAEVVPLFGLGGVSIGDAFIRGFAYGAAVSSLEMATGALSRKTSFTIPLLVNAQTFSIEGIAPPPLPKDNLKEQLEKLRSMTLITDISKLSIEELEDGRVASIYDKKSGTLWVIKL